jgi:hypothetical protein
VQLLYGVMEEPAAHLPHPLCVLQHKLALEAPLDLPIGFQQHANTRHFLMRYSALLGVLKHA